MSTVTLLARNCTLFTTTKALDENAYSKLMITRSSGNLSTCRLRRMSHIKKLSRRADNPSINY
jgi:hypothetical protein